MLFCFLFIFSINNLGNNNLENTNNQNNMIKTNQLVEENVYTEEINLNENIDYNIWRLEIPKINLVADISEGTDNDILNKYIGHFEETPKYTGNVCLAAHNRGYSVNYFEKIKELEIGDEIYYICNGQKNYYIVNSKNIIKDTDWSKLENTYEDTLTLITCVENQPNYRRCIQAIKKY